MVNKSDNKNSRIFHQCYLKCCKLQNLTPLANVIPSANGKVLDFCVDRIKYVDWPPILNAICCDLSLHSISIKCRQPVKTVLEHIDCERLAKTINKRPVILTNFMLNNLVEALSQLLTNTTLLSSLLIEGLPLKIPYLHPICDTLLTNNSLQHLYLPRCLIGDAGCLAICKAVRCLPNILTLDLSGCELTHVGADCIAELVKYQKLHRYSENWVHTLRYRLPDLDTMAGLRRISLCGNPQIGDQGACKLLEVLADDLWIKALDIQNCGLTEECASSVLQMLKSNTTLVILDLRHNPSISSDALSKIRSALRKNERGAVEQYSWLTVSSGSTDRSQKTVITKNGLVKEKVGPTSRNAPNKYTTKPNTVKKEKDYAELLEEQLQEEVSHRQQLEELNTQLVNQMKRLKEQQMQLWTSNVNSSESEKSFPASSRSADVSSSSGSASSVPIDQTTLAYIQQAFRDIYTFIKDNQCHGECLHHEAKEAEFKEDIEPEHVPDLAVTDATDIRVNITPKRARSSHVKMTEHGKKNKMTKSAHLLGDMHTDMEEMKPEMIERHMGDVFHAETNHTLFDEIVAAQTEYKKSGQRGSGSGSVSDSSETLVAPHPASALFSSSDEDDP